MSPTKLSVVHLDGDRFRIEVRGHQILVDQPIEAGGADTAPTPTELFAASLAGCVAFFARRYLVRHGLPTAGLAVTSEFEIGGAPARVTTLRVEVTPPPELPAVRRDAFLAVISHCTVHNTLAQPPGIDIHLVTEGER